MIRITKLLTFLIFIISCSNHKTNLKSIQSDTSKFKLYDSSDVILYEMILDYSKELKIENLKNGYDSLQIRIWYDYSIYPERKVVILKYNNSVWTATLYKMKLDTDIDNYRDTLKTLKQFISVEKEDLIPKNNWSSFINKLLTLKILNLPIVDELKGCTSEVDDGVEYLVEVASRNKYRFYTFANPETVKNDCWQAQNMIEILNLIDNELKKTQNANTLASNSLRFFVSASSTVALGIVSGDKKSLRKP